MRTKGDHAYEVVRPGPASEEVLSECRMLLSVMTPELTHHRLSIHATSFLPDLRRWIPFINPCLGCTVVAREGL